MKEENRLEEPFLGSRLCWNRLGHHKASPRPLVLADSKLASWLIASLPQRRLDTTETEGGVL